MRELKHTNQYRPGQPYRTLIGRVLAVQAGDRKVTTSFRWGLCVCVKVTKERTLVWRLNQSPKNHSTNDGGFG